jgi:hypothetical protein
VTSDPQAYSPERIARLLRDWEALLARAEGGHARPPDAGRPARGRRGDALAAADVVADIEWAIARCFRDNCLELRAVRCVQEGRTLSVVALALNVRKENVLVAYHTACQRLARTLGWDEPEVRE